MGKTKKAKEAQLLAVFKNVQSRIEALEREASSKGVFKADPEIIAEGEFLAQQLGGVEGAEGSGPLFLEAVRRLEFMEARLAKIEAQADDDA